MVRSKFELSGMPRSRSFCFPHAESSVHGGASRLARDLGGTKPIRILAERSQFEIWRNEANSDFGGTKPIWILAERSQFGSPSCRTKLSGAKVRQVHRIWCKVCRILPRLRGRWRGAPDGGGSLQHSTSCCGQRTIPGNSAQVSPPVGLRPPPSPKPGRDSRARSAQGFAPHPSWSRPGGYDIRSGNSPGGWRPIASALPSLSAWP